MNYQTIIVLNGEKVKTLRDILPDGDSLEILFIAKTPTEKSVIAGHYFQGQHGQNFWNQLKNYKILKTNDYGYEDEYLLDNHFGITDIVKKPRNYSNEPSNEEYREGVERIVNLIKKYKPNVIVFVYKKVLDKMIEQKLSREVNSIQRAEKATYGFNEKYEKYFGCKVFVIPLPGVGGQSRNEIKRHMEQLEKIFGK